MTLLLRASAFAVLIAILVLLLGPATTMEADFPWTDKAAHFAAFGALLWTFGVLIPRQRRTTLALFALLVGGMTEFIQGWTGRDADWLDLAADAAGIAIALSLWALWRNFQPRRSRQQILE